MYALLLSDQAKRQLQKLDRPVARRIAERIERLRRDTDRGRHEPLTEDLEGYFKLRTGDYRVIYQLSLADKILAVETVGHRRDIYRRR